MKKKIIFISLIFMFLLISLFTIDKTHSTIHLKDAYATVIYCDPPNDNVCAKGKDSEGNVWIVYGHARIVIE